MSPLFINIIVHNTCEDILEHTDHTLHEKVVCVLGDGHCLRRALGKIDNISPGEVVKRLQQQKSRNSGDEKSVVYQWQY